MGGMEITPDITVKEIEAQKGDLLILPGSDTWSTENNGEILDFVKNNIGKDITIAAICGAAIALAYNGLLNEVKHTSENLDLLKMTCPNYSGEKKYCNVPAMADGNLITASGLAPLEFTYEIFKRINVMEKNSVEAWYNLFKTREGQYFFELMDSIK
jgi:putative intracellular protease/amidase